MTETTQYGHSREGLAYALLREIANKEGKALWDRNWSLPLLQEILAIIDDPQGGGAD
jgi:hypothetical protein